MDVEDSAFGRDISWAIQASGEEGTKGGVGAALRREGTWVTILQAALF